MIRRYLRWKYGGAELPKPPWGWPPWSPPGLGRRAVYFAAYRVWLLDLWLSRL